jgi:hypothetical protein
LDLLSQSLRHLSWRARPESLADRAIVLA